jgi:peptidoglycan DL-endopeptidase CwlO
MKLRPVRILTALMLGLVLTLLLPGYAPAQPTNDIQAKAAKLEKDLQAANAKVAELGKQLTVAQRKVDEAQAVVAAADARVQVAQTEIDRIKSLLHGRAASIYKVAGQAGPVDALNAEDEKDLSARSKYSDVAADHDNALIDEFADAKKTLDADKAAADKARAEAAAERDAVAATKADADAAAASQQRLLDQVTGEMEEALRARTAGRGAPGGPPPMGHGGGGAAAAFARDQVGKSYCNGANRFGPSCYDCSGLTHVSWRAGGLDIPTVSGPQGSAYPRVPIGSLQPGDLITTTSWSAHVGIWVGDGFVHATNYSNNPNAVIFVPGTGRVVDAVRPS